MVKGVKLKLPIKNPIIISECGWNWGDMSEAKDMISASHQYGADVVKFQLYDIDAIKSQKDDNYWGLKRCQLDYYQMIELAEKAQVVGIPITFSAFDSERLEWLDDVKIPFHKIATRMAGDESFCKEVLSRNKTVVATTSKENKFLQQAFNVKFLWCMSRREILKEGIIDFPNKFGWSNNYDGFSDHTIGLTYAKKALDLGATIIEKHFTFDKNSKGWDQPASMTFKELEELKLYSLSI